MFSHSNLIMQLLVNLRNAYRKATSSKHFEFVMAAGDDEIPKLHNNQCSLYGPPAVQRDKHVYGLSFAHISVVCLANSIRVRK